MEKFFHLSHRDQEYRVSLDSVENRNKDHETALCQIDTDKMLLPSGRRVFEYKEEFETYRAEGGQLRKKAYLNTRAQEDFGMPWDEMIAETKASMVSMFGYNKAWSSRADQIKLRWLADSGHAFAAFIIGEAFMKKGDDLAIEWLVRSHNAGHTHALLALSAYLAQNANPLGAIACKVISADSGCEMSQLMIFHAENIDHMHQCDPSEIREVLEYLLGKTSYSVARYLKAILLIPAGECEGVGLLDQVITRPLKQPKKVDLDDSFAKRERVIKGFCIQVRKQMVDSEEGSLAGTQCLVAVRNLSQSYSVFGSNHDLLKFDEHFQRIHRTMR
jgi:hypothetical protein|tara:strand:+ start:17640 stop:18632 length:993 start_codon:yes stop_codon:yes gene_type:complete